MDNLLEKTLKTIPQLPQTQAVLNDQLRDLMIVANRLGMYDAADWIADRLLKELK